MCYEFARNGAKDLFWELQICIHIKFVKPNYVTQAYISGWFVLSQPSIYDLSPFHSHYLSTAEQFLIPLAMRNILSALHFRVMVFDTISSNPHNEFPVEIL